MNLSKLRILLLKNKNETCLHSFQTLEAENVSKELPKQPKRFINSEHFLCNIVFQPTSSIFILLAFKHITSLGLD